MGLSIPICICDPLGVPENVAVLAIILMLGDLTAESNQTAYCIVGHKEKGDLRQQNH